MNKKRLEYDSLKSVLLHMDPNLRIKLALHIPSIRSVEKLIPMKISHLITRNYGSTINDTNYKVAIYRQYHDPEKTPRIHRKENEEGGAIGDLDQYGFETDWNQDPIENGDLELQRFAYKQRDVESRRMIEGGMVINEESLRRLGAFEPDFVDVELTYAQEIIDDKDHAIQNSMMRPAEEIQKSADLFRGLMLPFYYSMNNIPAPFTPYIQFSINGKAIERVEHSKRLCEAAKVLNTMLFGGRRFPIRVKEFSIPSLTRVLRLPPDLKTIVNTIQSHDIYYENLNTVILGDPDTVNIQCRFGELPQEINAKKLIISNIATDWESWIPTIRTLRYHEIVLKEECIRTDLEDYTRLIENWLEDPRPLGASLTYGLRKEYDVLCLLRMFETEFDGTMNNRKLVLTLNNGHCLEVTCEQILECPAEFEARRRVKFHDAKEEHRSNWALKIIVV